LDALNLSLFAERLIAFQSGFFLEGLLSTKLWQIIKKAIIVVQLEGNSL